MSLMEINRMSSGYGRTVIDREIQLKVEYGKILCVLGRNGVGKSTLLKTIMGIVETFEGEISFDGARITGLKPFQIANMGIAYAPQESALFDNLSVEQNLKVGLPRQSTSFSTICEEAFRIFPILKERLKQEAGTLSGGEKKMLLMARAMIRSPKLIILDEITEGVQPSVIDNISNALRKMNEQGVSVLLVEQNVDFALSVAHSYAVMNQGQIVINDLVDQNSRLRIEQYMAV
ncbi:branched-chain amino acid ABC transporter ATP-binding protein [Bacillus sp. Marseille-P3661]|uniref:branched-chain amino acid ABC transporter ATP-binding protein n=1 Tax=Bacillus sp. Marseille-P3661 TaxID=1936234 RepID=UPI000C858508|nr:ABC transporter ATP-binding protein [Bacillus sp. Marseille-P3661]